MTGSAERIGSLPYMSPELLSDGPRALDARSDLYHGPARFGWSRSAQQGRTEEGSQRDPATPLELSEWSEGNNFAYYVGS